MSKYTTQQLSSQASFLDGGKSFPWFDPDKYAVEFFQKELNYGELFAYLFRRYGYPTNSWDGYKEICAYTLTTTMPELWLRVSIKPFSTHFFGYYATEELAAKLNQEDLALLDNWEKQFKEWAWETHNYHPFTIAESYGREKTDRETETITRGMCELFPGRSFLDKSFDPDHINRLIAWLEQKREECVQEYTQINPKPDKHAPIVQGDLRWQSTQALKRAIADLMNPVRVRSAYINPTGRVEDSGNTAVEPHSSAGCSIPTEYVRLISTED